VACAANSIVTLRKTASSLCSWQIKYEDSDCEDVEWPELRKLLADGAEQPSKSAHKRGGGRQSK